MIPPVDTTFVSRGGLPSRITRPEPGPISRAATMQDAAAREVSSVREQMEHLLASVRQMIITLGANHQAASTELSAYLAQTQAVADQLALALAPLAGLEGELGAVQATIDTLRLERGQLQALCVIAEHLNSTLDKPEVLNRLLDDLLTLVGAERGALLLTDASGQLHFEAARTADHLPLNRSDFAISRGTVEQVWRNQQPLLANDARHDSRLEANPSVRIHGIHALMCAPLRAQGKTVGVVYVDCLQSEHPFTDQHLDLLAAFCNVAAIAIANANLFHQQWLQTQEIAAIKTYTDSILASLSSGVLAVDNAGRVTRANRAIEPILGVTVEAALGQPIETVLAKLQAPGVLDLIQQTAGEVDARRAILVRVPAINAAQARTVNVQWAALCDSERRRLGTVIVLDDLTELETAQHAAEIFRKYVHPDVVDLVTQHPSAAVLGGQTRDITALFADIRNYTAMGEALAPAALVELLNEYLALMTEAIFAQGGTVTMFQGDAVMAIFNAPQNQPDHALRAARAAFGIAQGIAEHNQRTGQRQVRCGVGVNSGPALVGNIGAEGRLQHYTAIGDTVNLAKRLEEHATEGQILLSDATYRLVAPLVKVHPIPDVRAKGKSHPVQVWELHGVE